MEKKKEPTVEWNSKFTWPMAQIPLSLPHHLLTPVTSRQSTQPHSHPFTLCPKDYFPENSPPQPFSLAYIASYHPWSAYMYV